MKQMQAVLLGAGNRGKIYSDYCFDEPAELKIIAAIDLDPVHLKEAADKYKLSAEMQFKDLDVFLSKKIKCDFVINATMDEMHYETSVKIINAGYNLLLEKPVTANPKELLEIESAAKKNGVKVLVCHVLRYTPFYSKIKKIIDSGEIGEVINMEMNEHVWIVHFIESYVRGKWNSEKKCGSGLLLAKSCHDTDLMCWLNNSTKPKKVSSFGSRSLFIEKNAPANSTETCFDCPCEKDCPYSAIKIHLQLDMMPFQTWAGIGKPINEITREEKIAFMKRSEYGKCAYKTSGDIVDRQTVSVEYENGSVASLNVIGGISNAGRWIHVLGTLGEIVGYVEENKFKLTHFDVSSENYGPKDEIIDVSKELKGSAQYGGHAGGDYGIMHDVVRFFSGENTSPSITSIDDSINGHMVVYAAEESRKEYKIIDFDAFKNSFGV